MKWWRKQWGLVYVINVAGRPCREKMAARCWTRVGAEWLRGEWLRALCAEGRPLRASLEVVKLGPFSEAEYLAQPVWWDR